MTTYRLLLPILFLTLSTGGALLAVEPPAEMHVDGVPEIPEDLAERVQQFQNARAASFRSWHPTKREMLIATRFGNTVQAHYLAQPGGSRRQLTFLQEPVTPTAMHRGSAENYFLFSMDKGGSEFFQNYRFDLDTGRHHLLSDGESRNSPALLNNRGDRYLYGSTKRNGRDTDLYVASPLSSPGEELVVRADGTFFASAWSPDDAKALIVRYSSANETDAFVLDVGTQKLEPIRVGVDKAFVIPEAFSADGKVVYLVSDHAGEFRRLYEYDPATGGATPLTDSIPWDIEDVALSADGKTLAFSANVDGVSEVHLLDTESRRLLESPKLPRGVASGIEFHSTRNEFAVTIRSHGSAGDIYSYDLDNKTTTRWTYSETGAGDFSALPEAELVHYPTFDQVEGDPRMIPAFVLKPAAKFAGPRPVLIDIHGGPEGQARPAFQRSSTLYLLNELGVAVIQPNVRGSSGYGKSYLLLDNGVKREDSVKDIGALLEWIKTRDDLDATRVAVIGGSYGGYMSLATMTHYSDKLKCGVELFGISHFGTFLKNTQGYRRHLRRAEYGDENDPTMWDFFETISPLNNAEKIKIPLLVFQGKNDPRVPYTESEQIVAKVRSNGGEVWYLLADNEGHGLANKPNRDYFDYASLTFLNRCLVE